MPTETEEIKKFSSAHPKSPLMECDEIAAYRNKDGTYNIEMHSQKGSVIIPRLQLTIEVSGGIGHSTEVELKFTGPLVDFKIENF